MKKLIITSAIAIALSLPLVLSAQPPHPNGGNAPNSGGQSNNPVGGGPSGAPIGSGAIILTLMAAAWGGKKVYNLRNEEKE